MNKKTIIGIEKFTTLSVFHWGIDRFKRWKGAEKNFERVMRVFINLNKQNFDFLGINANIISINDKPVVEFITSHFVGAIPLLSPLNGLPIANLEVVGRYGEDVASLIPLLSDVINPQFSDTSKLLGETQITPPIFFECCKYLESYLKAEKYHWRKFDNVIKIEDCANGSTLWDEYSVRIAKDPLQFNRFKNRKNVLTADHNEWAQLNFVLQLAINNLENNNVPIRIKLIYHDIIQKLKIKLQNVRTQFTSGIFIHASDPLCIKELKTIANKILNSHTKENYSWRINYTEFFERFVQYLFKDIAQKKGAQIYNNARFNISGGRNISWTLNYLEPDIILKKGDNQYVIDAKYKSHIYNRSEISDDLKDNFRHDVHQILAYSSFSPNERKKAILVYPYSEFYSKTLNVQNPITRLSTSVLLLGIPLQVEKLAELKGKLAGLIDFGS